LGIKERGGTGAGQIGVSGSNVTYAALRSATWAGGTNGAQPAWRLIVRLDRGRSGIAARTLTFSTTTRTPRRWRRYVRFTLIDHTGKTSNQPIAVVIQDLPAVNTRRRLTRFSIRRQSRPILDRKR